MPSSATTTTRYAAPWSARMPAPSGKSVEYNYVNVFHIADGKVTETWGMAENDAETDPIWDEFASTTG